MILYPAIDILDGSAVRLVQGDFEAKKVYDEDPLDAARGWVAAGAKWLHVVDLDGAQSGAPVNLGHVRRIAGELGVPVQHGGGLRSARAVADALAAGAARASSARPRSRSPACSSRRSPSTAPSASSCRWMSAVGTSPPPAGRRRRRSRPRR